MKVSGFRFRVAGLAAAALTAVFGCVATDPSLSANAVEKVEVVEGKNVYNVRFQTLPKDCERLLAADPQSWDFNFRPYGRTADLVSDPAIVRGVAEGKNVEGKPTALRVSCDEDGWNYLVFCAEPDIDKAQSEAGQLPLPNLEMYFLPGDTDNEKPAFYWQFYKGVGQFDQYDWPVADRRWRLLMPYVTQETRRLPNGYVFRMNIPWEGMWDKLPIFNDRVDNFWRLSVIRWVDGGMTWGGTVHEPARFGYIRWPDFTDAQKTEIMKRLLDKAWENFLVLSSKAAFSVAGTVANSWGRGGYVRSEPYAVAQAKEEGPRSYINYCEDPEFRPILEKLTAAAKAYGAGIAEFAKKPMAEQEAFYKEASAKLFNFRYDVEEAYEKQLRAKFVK